MGEPAEDGWWRGPFLTTRYTDSCFLSFSKRWPAHVHGRGAGVNITYESLTYESHTMFTIGTGQFWDQLFGAPLFCHSYSNFGNKSITIHGK